jgi:CRP-like cAMP-binding protein
MSKKNIDYLLKIPPFKDIDEDKIVSLDKSLKIVDHPKDYVIFKAGDSGDCFYVIKEGTVRVFINAPETDEKIFLSSLSEGDYFGEMALLTGGPRSASVEAASDVTLIRLDKSGFEQLLEEDPKISISISNMLSQRLMEANLQRAASEQFYQSKISPSGSLIDFPVMQVLKFCEENSLTGRLYLHHELEKAEIVFVKGNVQKVRMDNLSEADAMDTLTQWEDGRFKIEPTFFYLEDQAAPQKEKTDEVVENKDQDTKKSEDIKTETKTTPIVTKNVPDILEKFLQQFFEKLVDLVGSQNLKEIAAKAHEQCKTFFPALDQFKIEIVPEVKIDLAHDSDWTDKETLAIAVYGACKRICTINFISFLRSFVAVFLHLFYKKIKNIVNIIR